VSGKIPFVNTAEGSGLLTTDPLLTGTNNSGFGYQALNRNFGLAVRFRRFNLGR
jgi:hypothetical protein